MLEASRIQKDIDKGNIHPLYLLMGEETYFIDQVEKHLSTRIISEEEKTFDQSILYGREISVEYLIDQASQYPLVAPKRIIIIREAQLLSSIDTLHRYTKNPYPTTILVLCYKHKTLDKRKKVYKDFLSNGVIFHSKKLYPNQVLQWLKLTLNQAGYEIEYDALQLIVESVGTDIDTIKKEVDKLIVIFPKKHKIRSLDIEKHIGVHRSFNNFELRKAIGVKDYSKALQIISYFSENPKSNPIVVTIGTVYNFLVQLLQYHGLSDQSKANVARVLQIHPYFVEEYQQAANNYTMKQVSAIIESIKKIDLKSKGVGARQLSHRDLLKEILIYIFFNV